MATLDQLAKTDLPAYLSALRTKCQAVQRVLLRSAAACAVIAPAELADIRDVFSQASNNAYGRKIVAEYDLAAYALAIPSPGGQRNPVNRPNYNAGVLYACSTANVDLRVGPDTPATWGVLSVQGYQRTTRDVPCCDLCLPKDLQPGLAVFVAKVMLQSRYLTSWGNPNTNLLRDAVTWGIKSRGQDANAFELESTLLQLLSIAPIPAAWNATIQSALVAAEAILAQRNLDLAKRQALIQGYTNVHAKLGADQFVQLDVMMPPAASGGVAPETQLAPLPKPFDWKPIAIVGGAALTAGVLLIFVRRLKAG